MSPYRNLGKRSSRRDVEVRRVQAFLDHALRENAMLWHKLGIIQLQAAEPASSLKQKILSVMNLPRPTQPCNESPIRHQYT